MGMPELRYDLCSGVSLVLAHETVSFRQHGDLLD